MYLLLEWKRIEGQAYDKCRMPGFFERMIKSCVEWNLKWKDPDLHK